MSLAIQDLTECFYNLKEHAYKGNMGFEELMLFYKKATPDQVQEMEAIIRNQDWIAFRMLIQKVTGVTLTP